ncbi:hypothetical protein [Paenibacillus sp. 481]|uniref:hypothetical protein n=1 Tax=Paenibacillus sp. 481 TaxID=2835869 RepID=UPI001E2DB1B2|nr:hypothetical protein [Paenibacillus sp. 481]UHA72241.1 hypothetical protein KIK04_16285 [Paenibacillus sp. 481]
MNATVRIPHGEQTIKVELTVKEAMALMGQRFHEHPSLKSDARRKVAEQIDRLYGIE